MNSNREVRSQKSEVRMNRYGKILASALCVLILGFTAVVLIHTAFGSGSMPGQIVGENQIPLGRDKATAPYAVFQCWGDGSNTKKCFDDSDDTLKLGATYANCAIRFEQDAVTKVWWCQVPATLPSGSYLVIIRDGADGAEVNTDTDVSTPVITWSMETPSLKVVLTDVFVSY